MKKLVIVILVSIFCLTQNIFSLEKNRNYSDTIAFIKTLNSNFIVKELDTVEYKSYKYPIYKISYNPQKENKGKKYLIISGVHGNEPAPVYAIKDFIISLNNKDVKRKDLQIDFILIVNPFGFEFNQIYNGNNLDINRDMTKLKTREAQILVNNFKPKNYDKVFDFHEANASGFFLYCYGVKNKKISDNILKELAANNVVFDNKYKDKILEVENGKLYVPLYASIYMKNKETVTTGIFYANCKNSFTFETSKNINIEERKRIIKIILNFIIENA